jgi:hypothetical protein
MAHFAKINADNIVEQVIVVNNEEVPDETTGIAFCKSLFGEDTEWVQTSYNNNFRVRYAGIGYTYNAVLNAFIEPKCHDEATLDEATYKWICANEAHTIKE